MDELARYRQKCQDFATKPVEPFEKQLSLGQPLRNVTLKGNSKELFQKRMTSMDVYSLCEFLQGNEYLEVVDFSYNFLDDLATKAVAALLRTAPRLQTIRLVGNNVGPTGARVLAEALSGPGGGVLRELDLSGNPLENDGALALADMLRRNLSLAALRVPDTRMGMRGVVGITTALSEQLGGEVNEGFSEYDNVYERRGLVYLDIGDIQVEGPQDDTTVKICSVLARHRGLRHLGMSKHKLDDHQMRLLTETGLARLGMLTRLDLRGNRISPFSGATLEFLLAQACPRLMYLDISSNKLGNDGAMGLARGAAASRSLRVLDVRKNHSGDIGMMALAEALVQCRSLTTLLVWGNKFGPPACTAFLEALEDPSVKNRNLTIDLTPYVVDGVANVAEVDPVLPQLEPLWYN